MATCTKQPIHILGIGNLGILVANALATTRPASAVTLLLHHPSLAAQWEQGGQCVNVITNGVTNRQSGFNAEITFGAKARGNDQILHLIVATKAYATVEALRPINHRLRNDSTILFLQNGMGTTEEVTAALFANSFERPCYLDGIVSHGVYKTGPFSIVHAGIGNISLGSVHAPSESETLIGTPRVASADHLVRCLVESPILSACLLPRSHLLQAQLEKLVINAVINPLTVIFDCLNGELFYRPRIRDLIQDLLVEISTVLQPIVAGSTANPDPAPTLAKFSPTALERLVADVAAKTALNISSMRQDVQAGRTTEIDYINGYIVSRGSEQDRQCSINRTLIQMIRDRRIISERDTFKWFPRNIGPTT